MGHYGNQRSRPSYGRYSIITLVVEFLNRRHHGTEQSKSWAICDATPLGSLTLSLTLPKATGVSRHDYPTQLLACYLLRDPILMTTIQGRPNMHRGIKFWEDSHYIVRFKISLTPSQLSLLNTYLADDGENKKSTGMCKEFEKLGMKRILCASSETFWVLGW